MINLIFIVPIVSLLGIFCGFLLKKIAREEIKFGKFGSRYFVWMKRIILSLIIIIVLYFTKSVPLVIFTAVLGFILSSFLSEYLFLGTALVFSFIAGKEMLITMASLIFLYGLPYGSMLRRFEVKHLSIILLFFLPFILLAVDVDSSVMIGLTSGGCLQYLIRK